VLRVAAVRLVHAEDCSGGEGCRRRVGPGWDGVVFEDGRGELGVDGAAWSADRAYLRDALTRVELRRGGASRASDWRSLDP
jgi:hypothetical protein